MRPKYTLTDFSGKMMFEKSILPFVGQHHVTMGVLQEHEAQYHVSKYVQQTYGDQISVVVLPERTTGPAHTVYEILKQIGLDYDQEIFILDFTPFSLFHRPLSKLYYL
jgi:hypothetical protein